MLAADLGVEDRLGDRVDRVAVGLEHLGDVTVRLAPDPDHRVDHQMDRVALARELHRHRVDDERHVVGDDLDHGVRRLPAVLLEVRVVDAHLRLAGRALLGEVPVRDRRPVQVERVAIGQVLGGHPVVVLAHERLTRLPPAPPAAAPVSARRRRRSARTRVLPPLPLFRDLLGHALFHPGTVASKPLRRTEPTPGAIVVHVLQSGGRSTGSQAGDPPPAVRTYVRLDQRRQPLRPFPPGARDRQRDARGGGRTRAAPGALWTMLFGFASSCAAATRDATNGPPSGGWAASRSRPAR